ncbi:RNA polymerase sigma factor [Agromyces humatus]|nr:sigma-70 family RNA polymerase sigma factor [Agromyces humatus]
MDEAGDEQALWARVLIGDDIAFTAIFDLHAARVHRQARRLVKDERDAEDVTAMVFFEAWRRRGSVRFVNDSLAGWLLVTTTNVVRNRERSRVRYEALLRKVRVETVPDHADAVLESVERPAMQAQVRGAFDRLSARDQEILTLCVIEELAPVDVARVLRVPAGTVRMRLSRAKARLRAAVHDAQQLAVMTEIGGTAP